MAIDYAAADQVCQLAFERLNRSTARLDFARPGTLSAHLKSALEDSSLGVPTLQNQQLPLLASAGVEMWHRAIHSFICSVKLEKYSPIWASVSGYYASHFVMRGIAHSMGIFKSFVKRTGIQLKAQGGVLVCEEVGGGGEHAFYWQVVKSHPAFNSNPLFRENHERESRKKDASDAIHRNFANYTDHIDSFSALSFSSQDEVADRIVRISQINRHCKSAPTPQRDGYPDVATVQVLAYQRIVCFREFFDSRFASNRFWKTHRNPTWCRNLLDFQISDDGLLDDISEYLKPLENLSGLP